MSSKFRKFQSRLSNIKSNKMALKDRFAWGKYQGRSLEYVLYEDPEYLIFVQLQGHFDVNEEVLKLAREKINNC